VRANKRCETWPFSGTLVDIKGKRRKHREDHQKVSEEEGRTKKE